MQIKIRNLVKRGIKREEVLFHDLEKGDYKIYSYPIKNTTFREYVYSRIKQFKKI